MMKFKSILTQIILISMLGILNSQMVNAQPRIPLKLIIKSFPEGFRNMDSTTVSAMVSSSKDDLTRGNFIKVISGDYKTPLMFFLDPGIYHYKVVVQTNEESKKEMAERTGAIMLPKYSRRIEVAVDFIDKGGTGLNEYHELK